jgi:3-(3-hydroxy-phenyl)propionate hydroxylase
MHLNELAARHGDAVDYQRLVFDYQPSIDQQAAAPARRPVAIIGAGPVGLALAIDLAQRNVPVVVLDNDDTLSTGSRAICFAKRTLEIFDRLGCGHRMAGKGVSWNVGKVFFRDEQVYSFDLLPESGHARPAFVNLQQYYVEGYLAERAAALPLVDVRWKNALSRIDPRDDHVLLTIDTPDGPYRLAVDYVAACDGSRSTARALMGLESKGRTFKDRFLIADVRMKHEAPAERWFWFDPEFHPNQSVLLHRQPDGVWRIDFQLGWDADPEVETRPENILPRVRALLAHSAMKDLEFELEWASVYTFRCQRMDTFRHGRVLFAGDSAHGVSPFGARGANSGVQDADNLAWKLAAVLQGHAPAALLDSYANEREYAADENIRHSTRATDFITPKSDVSRLFRDAVLELSKTQPFARSLVNSGRLSTPSTLRDSALNTPDADLFQGAMVPGAPAADAPVVLPNGESSWLLRELGAGFTVLAASAGSTPLDGIDGHGLDVKVLAVGAQILDESGMLARRYDLQPGTVYLLRPDQHVCARWRAADADRIGAAIRHALAVAIA